MEKNQKILVGEKSSHLLSALSDFEGMTVEKWQRIRKDRYIPDNFLFLAGVAKYPKHCPQANLRFGKDVVFVQNFLPYNDNGIYRTRRYGNIYCLYEPEKLFDDDVVLEKSALYLALPDDTIKMVLADGEHRQLKSVDKMFHDLCEQRGLQDFSRLDDVLGIYEVTFKTKSCGYFLKDRTYLVWAMPIGIPDRISGELVKGWIICDINCGVPAILKANQETLCRLPSDEGDKIGMFTMKENTLVF